MERRLRNISLGLVAAASMGLIAILSNKDPKAPIQNNSQVENIVTTNFTKQNPIADNQEIQYAISEFSDALAKSKIIFPIGEKINESMEKSPYERGLNIGQIITTDANMATYSKKGETNGHISLALSLGNDHLGNPRNLEDTLNANPSKKEIAASWANTNLYPIRTSEDKIRESLKELVKNYLDTENRKYVLEESPRYQVIFDGNKLPFYSFTFIPDKYSQNKIVSRPELKITVRNAGKDLLEGEIALTKFNYPGYIFPEEKPKVDSSPKQRGLSNLLISNP